MKNVILFLLLLSVIFNARAQDLTISFQPKVSGTPIDSIRATNLRTNQSVKLTGSEMLLLVRPTGINPLKNVSEAGYVFPNPTDKDATLSFSTNTSQEIEVRLFNVTGQLLGRKMQNITQGIHYYQLKFPVAGVYYVSVNKSDGNESFKVVYSGRETQSSSIEYAGSESFKTQNADVNYLKSANAGKTLTYKAGDIIQYSIASGVNTTIISETPISSKAIDVEFVSCIDNDNRSYKIVQIGDQWWMAENLNVGKVVIGDGNTNQLDNKVIEKYSYQNLESNLNKYGGLYQWNEMMTHVGEVPGKVKGICPDGWHLPSKYEWLTLFNSVGGADVAGKKLKSVAGYNNSGNGTDVYGFNALPSGMYAWDGKQPQLLKFMGLGDYSAFYTSTSIDHMVSYTGFASNSNASFIDEMEFWGYGLCVRCIRDYETSSSQNAPVADFTASKTNLTKGETIQFSDKSINSPVDWAWSFGDGSNSRDQNPLKIYYEAGNYIVSLEAFNAYGSNIKKMNITVTEPAPVSYFTASDTTITKGQSVQFSDKSTNKPTSWLWKFGDGTTSTEQNPSKTYNSVGTFTVSLQVSNSSGSNTKTITLTVTETIKPDGTGILVYEGRTYKTIILNGKEWLAENLAYLPTVYSSSNGSYTEPRYYVYDYQGTDVAAAKASKNYTTYGVLYNWVAAKAACPPGWHLPSDDEWTILTTYLGGISVAGGKMKEAGMAHWLNPNYGATNESGFSALPGGIRISNGVFGRIGSDGLWWSSTVQSPTVAGFSILKFDNSKLWPGGDKKEAGFSVRCVKD